MHSVGTIVPNELQDMPDSEKSKNLHDADDFARLAAERQPGIVTEYWQFLRQNRNWWLIPVLLVLLLLGTLVFVGGTAAAPFLYTLF